MTAPVRLRAHHGMCLAFFEGKGYSSGFTAHMAQVLEFLQGDPLVELAAGRDTICGPCPNLEAGVCQTAEKVARYDAQVLSLCGLKAGDVLPWSDFSRLVKERILTPGLRQGICGDCQWNDLCASRAASPNF